MSDEFPDWVVGLGYLYQLRIIGWDMADISPWRQAEISGLSDETLRALIQIVDQHLQLWGRMPTPQQVKQELLGSGPRDRTG